MTGQKTFVVRSGQAAFERDVREHRICGLLARRQYGKTTIAARIALRKMMATPGHDVIFGSVKLDLGREMVRKESVQIRRGFQLASADGKKKLLNAFDETGHNVSTVNPDDWAGLYESSKLEFRLYHSKSVYSRTKVVALTPEAVGETGDLILDEVGRVRNFREVCEAMQPFIAGNPGLRIIYTTTPPPDDTHYSFDLLSPPIGVELPVNPKGNTYRSEHGVYVRRITAFDAFADNVPLYDDDTGAPISPAESRARAHDKDAWDRNYDCRFVIGGSSACGLLQLDTAQRRGIGQCQLFVIHDDSEFRQALAFLHAHLGEGPIGIGVDTATTTKGASNPTVVSVVEQSGVEYKVRCVFVWKTADPAVAMERLKEIVRAIRSGGRRPARRLCIDATNERYFATTVRTELGGELPVELVIASETVEIPGQEEPITKKQYLGSLLVAELDDNHLWLPPERYLREDWRIVRKEKGQFVCDPDVEGRHGDTFDGTKQGVYALKSNAGQPAYYAPISQSRGPRHHIRTTKGCLA